MDPVIINEAEKLIKSHKTQEELDPLTPSQYRTLLRAAIDLVKAKYYGKYRLNTSCNKGK